MTGRTRAWLLLGDGLSAFGSWIDFLAILTLAAYQYHVSPYQMAAVSAAGLLPGMLAAPAIGRWCDAGDPRRLLLVSIALRIAATAGVLLVHDYAVFLLLVGLRSVFAMVAPPAINVLALRVVPPQGVKRFYSLLNLINSSAKILAPAIGTVSSSLRGESLALWMSALFSALALVVFARVPAGPAAARDDAGARGQGAAGTAVGMLPLLWIAGTQAFMTFAVNNLVPVVLQRAGSDKSLLGLLVSCSGAGNILAGAWLARRAASRPGDGSAAAVVQPALLQAGGFAAMACLLAWAPARLDLALATMFFLVGTASARYAVGLNVYLATRHGAQIGVASGRLQSCQNAMILVAPMVGAAVLDRWGGATLFAFAAGVAALSFATFAAAGSLRGARRQPA